LTSVTVDKNFERAFRQFKRKVERAGTLQTVRDKQYFEKPSTKRNRKKAAGRARCLKRQKAQQLPPEPRLPVPNLNIDAKSTTPR
jgi:small subunit ribosomal protein S21